MTTQGPHQEPEAGLRFYARTTANKSHYFVKAFDRKLGELYCTVEEAFTVAELGYEPPEIESHKVPGKIRTRLKQTVIDVNKED